MQISDLTLVVVAHNAASRLPATLRALSQMNCPAGLQVEFIFVDNRSTDDSAEVVAREWEACGGRQRFGPWTLLHEQTPGSAFARRTGIRHASNELVLLVDDDNSLHRDYVSRGLELFNGNPRLGACAGVGVVKSPVPIPEWFPQVESLYVCGERGLGRCAILPTAGLMVRRCALMELDAVGFRPVMEGRVGADTMCGEDSELTAAISMLGWELWKDPGMRFDHVLEPRRLTEEYCLKLAEGIGRSNVFVAEYTRWVARARGRRVWKFAIPWHATLRIQRMLYTSRLLTTRGSSFASRKQRATFAGLKAGAALGLRTPRFRQLRREIRRLYLRIREFRQSGDATGVGGQGTKSQDHASAVGHDHDQDIATTGMLRPRVLPTSTASLSQPPAGS